MQNKAVIEDQFDFGNRKSDRKDFLRFFSKILSNWYWFLLCGLLGSLMGYLYLRYTLPEYKIHAKLLVSDDKKGGLLGESALAGLSDFIGTKSSVDNEVEVLKTGDLLREMILAEEAYINHFLTGTVHNVPISKSPYSVELLSSPDSIKELITLEIFDLGKGIIECSNSDTTFNVKLDRPFNVPKVGLVKVGKYSPNKPIVDNEYGFSLIPIRDVMEDFAKRLEVEVTNKNVSTIDLTLQSPLTKKGEKLLVTLIEKYVERNLHDKNVVADSTLSFINARLQKVTDELAGVEDRISGYKQSTKLADISEQSRILLESSADYTKSIAETDAIIESLDAVLSYLKDNQQLRVVPSAAIPQDVTFSSLVSRYNELVLQRERLLLANTEDNPLVKNLTNQIAGLRADMISNAGSTRRQLELTKQNQQRLSSSLTSQIRKVPTIERGYIDLARLQQIKQAQYIFLQEKWEETAIGRTANVSNSKVIDSPKSEKFPFSPKRKVVLILGLILGLLIPLIIIYLKDYFNVRIESKDDIDRITKLPVLGAISHSDQQDQIVITDNSRSPIVEQFRAMRTNLEFALNGGKRVLFTSSMSGEGKSYVALNLAMALTLLGKRVVLMELDLRKPSILGKLGLDATQGFSHFIVRPEMTVDDVIKPSKISENLFIVEAGAIPPNPAELLVHDRAEYLMRVLNDRFDYVLIDAPPVGLVTDAQLLDRYVDCTLYLVRQSYTYKEQLNIPNDLTRQNKMKSIHLVINDVPTSTGYYGSYGYGYGYGYDYGQYGETENPKKKWRLFK